jgi:hypothetical protein
MADSLNINLSGTLITANTSLFNKSNLLLTSAENRKEEVLLTNETYTLDLTKYANINAICIESYYNANSTTPTIVTEGDPAPFGLSINGGATLTNKGMFLYLPNTAPTALVIDSTIDTRQLKFKIGFITSA